MSKEKFIIIDGNSLANRAFYAIPLLSNSQGVITNAAYGFTNMLRRLFDDEKPDYIAVAFDKGRLVFRHADYEDYKAQRKGMPDDLRPQMQLIKSILSAMNISIFEEEGYEADDLIGTMVKWGEEQGWQNLIVTGDKDALQLVTKQTKVLLTRKGITELEIYDLAEIKQKYNLKPEQIIDLKGLMGDASDNIPGVPGVGEKTALKLLDQYGNIENLLENLDDFQGKKLGERLNENKELAVLSKKLATIFCQIEMDLDRDSLKVKEPNREDLIAIYQDLEFKNLLKVLIEKDRPAQSQLKSDGLIINHPKDLKELLSREKFQELSIYLISDSPDAARGKVTALGLKFNESILYIPQVFEFSLYARILKPYLEDEQITKITYDAKLLHIFFLREEINIRGLQWDILLGFYLIDPSRNDLSLKTLIFDYLQILLPEDNEQQAFAKMQALTKIAKIMIELLEKDNLMSLYLNTEILIAKVLAAMELQGIKLDLKQLKAMGKELEEEIEVLTDKILLLAGEEFNINSPKQLGKILFEKLGLPAIKKTKTGYSTDIEVLEALAAEHAIAREIIDYRQLVKLKSTYVDGLIRIVNPKTKKVHTSFNQTITATGRLSSTEPNLQNIPIRLEEGRKIRKSFIPSKEGYILLTADYSQIELRVLAHMAQDPVLIEAFNKGEDIHLRTAAEVFKIPIEEVTKEMRQHAKAINFGIIYGLSDFGLAKDLGISRPEAKNYIDSYFLRYFGVRIWIDNILKEARNNGYVTTLLGRRRYIKDILSKNYNLRSFAERTAMNTPIQGSAADIIKLAMVRIYQKLVENNYRAKMILQVHDELVFEIPPHECSKIISMVKETMETAYPLDVPLKVDMQAGFNWYDLENLKG